MVDVPRVWYYQRSHAPQSLRGIHPDPAPTVDGLLPFLVSWLAQGDNYVGIVISRSPDTSISLQLREQEVEYCGNWSEEESQERSLTAYACTAGLLSCNNHTR